MVCELKDVIKQNKTMKQKSVGREELPNLIHRILGCLERPH